MLRVTKNPQNQPGLHLRKWVFVLILAKFPVHLNISYGKEIIVLMEKEGGEEIFL